MARVNAGFVTFCKFTVINYLNVEYIIYMDMFKTGVNKTHETLTAVGGGVKYSKKLPFWRLVC